MGKYLLSFILLSIVYSNCLNTDKQAEFYVDKNWIEVHFLKTMPTEKLVEIRERLVQYGVILNYITIKGIQVI